MAYLFSKVTLEGGGYDTSYLTGGIPRDFDDLSCDLEFEDFLELIERDEEISVHVDAYLYGQGESCIASEDDIKGLEESCKNKENFLEAECDNIESHDFTFEYSPEISEFDRFPLNRYDW